MKRYRTANRILAVSLLLFLCVLTLSFWGPFREEKWFSILYFLAQSCFIGCVADFIAVEALFRRRFHLPYRPIIPANRERIIGKMKDVNNTLLSRENLLKKVETLSVTDMAQQWLFGQEGRQEEMERRLAEKAARGLVDFVENNREEAGAWVRKEAGKRISAFCAYAKDQILSEMHREEWLDRLLFAAEDRLSRAETKKQIAAYMKEKGDSEKKGFLGTIGYWLGRKTGAIDYEALTDAAVEALLEEMKTWEDRDNPFRRQLLSRWDSMVRAFLEEETTEKALAAFGTALFEEFPVEEKIGEAAETFCNEWGRGDSFRNKLVPKLALAIHRGVLSMEGNGALKERVDAFARGLLTELISYEHGFLSTAILDVLKGFSDKELNEFVESKVHHELEGIRINGAIVGLLGGCLFYLFLTFLWIPLVRGFF
jgi:uncharacterized membrane-anchored protein YjiN (DUF445 family)